MNRPNASLTQRAHGDRAVLTALMPLKHYKIAFLRKAIASLFRQNCPYWRLCLIVERRDRAHVARLLNSEIGDARVSLTVNEGRRLGGALNTGMRRAKTLFVAILFADDMWSPDAVTVLTEAIEKNPDIDFFHSSRIIIDEHDQAISSVHLSKPSFCIEDFLFASPVKHLLCWRRKLGLTVGGMDESHNHGPDDYDFPWTMAEAGAAFHAIPEPLYLYRDHREGYRLTTHVPLSSQKWALRRILKKHGIDGETIKARLASAEATYLKQCLFENRRDQNQKTKLGYDPHSGWRDSYQ